MILRHSLSITIFLAFFFGTSMARERVATGSVESFPIVVDVNQLGQKSIQALYDDDRQKLFLPVAELFDFLQIHYKYTASDSLLTGYVRSEKDVFTIDMRSMYVNAFNKKYDLKSADVLNDVTGPFLSEEALENAFGLMIDFKFRSLSASLRADYEIPAVRIIRIENARKALKLSKQEVPFDAVWGRQYHFFRFGMIDWSVNATQSTSFRDEVRLGLGTGAELFGGEANIWLNYSTLTGLPRAQQRYYWRWVNNDWKTVRQIQIGRLTTNSIASLLYPVDGVTITNAPSAIRKALGDYLITDYTSPDWMVELYVNNVLVGYQRASSSGEYSFRVPVVYGTTNVTLRFYGPNGEERSEEKTFNMPYNFLPKGEFEYRVTSGQVLDTLKSYFTRAEVSYGLAGGLTVGAGSEYLSSLPGERAIPFALVSYQPFARMIVTGEYAHNVRSKATLNYSLPGNANLELYYARYQKSQRAVIYNYLEERKASLSLPFRLKTNSGVWRTSFRQNLYANFNYNNLETSLSDYYRNFNATLSNYLSWTTGNTSNIYANLALGYRIRTGLNARLSGQYNFSFSQLISYKAELEKSVFSHGLLSCGYEEYRLSGYRSFNVAFKYDFSFMTTYASTFFNNKDLQMAQGARGSFAFGSGNGYIHADKQNAVGRCGIAIMPYIDKNFNGRQDVGESTVTGMNVRCNGGKLLAAGEDGVVRIVGLEPFNEYHLIFDEQGFSNLAWRIKTRNVKVITDPNQFKKLEICVQPMGEITGTVAGQDGRKLGNVVIRILDQDKKVAVTTQSEPDGYFSYIGLLPGKYTVTIADEQLRMLDKIALPVECRIEASDEGDIRDVGELTLRDKIVAAHTAKSLKQDSAAISIIDKAAHVRFDYPLYFDYDKYKVLNVNYDILNTLAGVMLRNPCLTIRVDGHTDTDGSLHYNQKLSEKRAAAIKKYLNHKGVPANRIELRGLGETRPVGPNRNEKEKQLNRRVLFYKTSGEECSADSIYLFSRGLGLSESYNMLQTDSLNQSSLQVKTSVNGKLREYKIYFESNSANIRPEYSGSLRRLARMMDDNPHMEITINGYTDPDGTVSYNRILSQKRAETVRNILNRYTMNSDRLTINALGESHPLNQNSSPAEKALNRRVDFSTDNASASVLKQYIDGQSVYRIITLDGDEKHRKVILSGPTKGCYLQAGAFHEKMNADALIDKLRTLVDGQNLSCLLSGNLYKVRITGFQTVAEAEAFAKLIIPIL